MDAAVSKAPSHSTNDHIYFFTRIQWSECYYLGLETWTLRPREVSWFPQASLARKEQCQDSNPGLPGSNTRAPS